MSLRRSALLLFGVMALAALAAPPRARAQAITAGLGGNPSALVGDSLDVPVVVDMTSRPERVGAFAARIRWNPAVLTFEAGLSGSFGAVTANVDSAPLGVIHLTGANPAGAGGLITLGIGRFIVKAADTTTLSLAFSELYAAGTFADLRPYLGSPASGLFCVAQGRYGDINGDGHVLADDALIALTNAVGLPVGSYDVALGDVDGNGVTDTRDALIMLSDAVGIDVSAFPRLGQILGGACATGATVTLAVTPAAVTGVLIDQELTFEARATGPTGALVTIPSVAFRSSDTTVLAFEGGADPATAMARKAGTVTVTAVRDAHDSAQTPVTVVARRGTHWVDAEAATATNQIGTQALPFATIGAALAVARAGDTIRPQPGRYPESLEIDSALVLMGDSLADGTRPLLAGSGGTGIYMPGSGTVEVRNLALDGFDYGLDIEGPSRVVLQGVVIRDADYAVFADAPLSGLWIVDSRLEGPGASSYSSSEAVELYGNVDTLVVSGSEIGDFAYDGVYANAVDSVAIHASRIHDVGSYAIEAWPTETGTVAVAMDSTVVTGATGTLSLYGVRSVALSHNSLSSSGGEGGNGMWIGGSGSGWVRIIADSTDQPGYYWLYAQSLDSVVVDSLYTGLHYGMGWFGDVALLRVTNSKFLNVTGTPLYVTYSTRPGGRVVLDGVSVTGDPRCDLCATGFVLSNAATVANRVTGVNLSGGFSVQGDSSFTLTNSLFSHVGSGVAWTVTDSGAPAQLTILHSTFSGFDAGVVASGWGAVVVDSNTFQSSLNPAIQVAPLGGSVQIVGNAFSDVYGAINVAPMHSMPVTISDNVADGVAGYGVIAGGGADSMAVAYQILRNAVTCNGAGAANGYGIELEQADGLIESNQVQGCWAGISTYAGAASRSYLVARNTVVIPASAYGGIYLLGPIKARVTGNAVSADTAGSSYYGDIFVDGLGAGGDSVTTQLDSNVVNGGTYYGISVAGVDSGAVLFNTVQQLANANCLGCDEGGIVTQSSIHSAARIYGNVVRAVDGVGISAANADTALLVVDSNLVSGNTYGMVLGDGTGGGAVHAIRNRITGSSDPSGYAGYGVYFDYPSTALVLVDSNNITGNRYGAFSPSTDYSYQVLNNWWGDALGPSCYPPDGCPVGSTGDSVTVWLNWSSWLTAPLPSGLPLTAPIGHTGRLAAVRVAAPALVRGPAGAPVTGGVSVMGRMTVRSALPVPPRAPAAAAAPARARIAAQAAAGRRAARAVARGQNLTAAAQSLAARAPQWTERIQAQVRATAERDSTRAAQIAQRAAAWRALRVQAVAKGRRP